MRRLNVRNGLFLWLCLFSLVGFLIFLCFQISANNTIITEGSAKPPQFQEGPVVYVKWFDLYKAVFTEPIESMLFVFSDGQMFLVTTMEEARINVYPSLILEHFKKRGKDLKDVLIIIHNHLLPGPFSYGDKYVCRYFRGQGFAGLYGIYHQASGEVEWYNEDGQ